MYCVSDSQQPPSLLWDQLQEEPFEEEEFSDLFARQVVQKKPVKKKEVKSPKKQVSPEKEPWLRLMLSTMSMC